MRKKLFIALIILFALQLLFRMYSYRDVYLQKFNAAYWKQRYLHSQWVVPNSKESIGDDGLYTYVAWEYVHGKDPSLLNAEIPPFAKYILGFFELVFQNQNDFALFSGLLVLTSFFWLNKLIFKDNLLSLLPVTLLSVDPLFFTQLRAPFLDLFYLAMILLTFIFTLKDKFWLATIFLGLATATKSSTTTFLLLTMAIVAYQLYMKHYQELKKFLIFLPLAIITFLATYLRYFLLGHNLHQFLGVQKYVLAFYAGGAKGNPAAVWQILLIGKWPNWFGPVQNVAEWNLLWPLSLFCVIYYLYLVLPKRKQYKSSLLAIWIVLYLLFLTVIPTWPRYLLLALPFMYNLTIWVLSKSMPQFWRRFS
jgi:predicted membrane-bound dolichyl-phosphate-mannose-protein mannosyltransferase